MSRFLDYSKNRQGGGAATVLQQREQPSGTVAEQPKIDKDNVLGSLSGMLGPTPAERAAEEERLQKHRRQMHGWTALFNGLRHLGNLYYATKGAPGQKFGEPHQQIEQQYQDERKRLADIHAADRSYYTNLYNIRRQMDDDERRNKLSDAQLRHYQTQDEMAREKARQQEEYNEARKKYYEAVSNKNDEQAEYWRLRAQGVPKESAAKIAKDYATAAKANRTGGGSGGGGRSGRNNGTYGYKTTTYYDEQGRKVTERVPTTGEKPAPAQQPKQEPKTNKPAQKGGSTQRKSAGNGGGKIKTGVNWK